MMNMNLSRAIIAGLAGCVVVLLVTWIAGYVLDADTDLAALSAATLFARSDGVAWLAGLIVQVLVGVIAAIVYAAIFEWVTRRAGLVIGLAIAVPHAVVAGLAVGFLPGERLIAAGIMPPGAFYEYRGAWCMAAFVVAHLLFGCIVGTVYGRTLHRMPHESAQWTEVVRA